MAPPQQPSRHTRRPPPGTLVVSLLMCLQAVHQHTRADTVVRPTVFVEQSQVSSSAAASSSQAAVPLSDGPLTAPALTKIHPIRSRLCTGKQGRTDAPLGLHSGAVPDWAITASSHSSELVRPHLARLNLELAGGAWCPGKPISNSNTGKEWIQVKLNRSYVVSAIETQGRFGLGSLKEYVPSYQIEYSRDSGRTWHKWRDIHGYSTLAANQDVSTPVRNELSPPIVGANVIRLLPHSSYLRTVCLRLEIHGCPYDDGAPIAYSVRDGVVDSRWGQLNDYTYDGSKFAAHLSHGLGQLTDGVKGHDNFSFNQGLEWVGWKSVNGDVELEFAFRHLRNFSGALFHSNNLFSSGVEVFQGLDVHYGIDVGLSTELLREALDGGGASASPNSRPAAAAAAAQQRLAAGAGSTLWSSDVLSIEYEPDKKSEAAREVIVHLKQRLANRLKFVLKFASKWILVSEVEFLSQPVELLSPELALTEPEETQDLVGALAGPQASPVNTYDQYLAILREHQLRRPLTRDYKSLSFLASASTGVAGSQVSSSSEPGSSYLDFASSAPPPPPPQQPLPAGLWPFGPQAGWTAATARAAQLDNGQPLPANSAAFSPMPPSQISYFASSAPGAAPGQLDQDSPGPAAADPATSFNSQQPASSSLARLASVIALSLATVLSLAGLLLLAVTVWRHRQSRLAHHHHSHSHHNVELARHLAALSGPAAARREPAGFWRRLWTNLKLETGVGHHQQHHHISSSMDHQRHLYKAILEGRASTGTLKGQPHGQPVVPGQLVVSMKEPGGGLFSASAGAASKQPSTQLIVGLNQANPLNQQLYGQHLYSAATYAPSISLKSSSTGRTPAPGTDYSGAGDYAIPDAQPIIPPLQPRHLNHGFLSSTSTGSRQQHQAGYLTELRRPPVAAGGQVATGPLISDHNYELVHQQQQQQLFMQHQPQPQRRVGSMTVARGLQRRPAAPPVALDQCSPAGSQASAATTATTSANSSHLADLYYYSASNTHDDQQQQQRHQ